MVRSAGPLRDRIEGGDAPGAASPATARAHMKVRVLGCSGGIGAGMRTTALMVDQDILIDAGTGVGDLTLEQLARIDHVFVTHSHLDHVASIPFLVDTVCWMRERPIRVHAIRETLQTLREHLFNWKLWPDFTQIPDPARPALEFHEVEVGRTVELGGRRITPLPADHTVPAVGYAVQGAGGALVFTGDTQGGAALWEAVNALPDLRYLIIETAFSNKERAIAAASRHLCPATLAEQLGLMQGTPEVFVTHLKPGEVALTMREVSQAAGRWKPRMLENDQEFLL